MSVGELSEHAEAGIHTYKYTYICVSRLQDTTGSFLFHHKTNFITITVDSYRLHNLKFIALLRLQHPWHHQANQISRNFQSYPVFSGVFLSYVMLIVFLLENIFLDCSLKSSINDLNVFLHHALSRDEGLVIREICWFTGLRRCFP